MTDNPSQPPPAKRSHAARDRDPEARAEIRQPPMLQVPLAQGRFKPPGPTRHFHRRHFARQESAGLLLMALIAAVVVFFWGVDIGLFPDVFGWKP